jgi:hypothetical protein
MKLAAELLGVRGDDRLAVQDEATTLHPNLVSADRNDALQEHDVLSPGTPSSCFGTDASAVQILSPRLVGPRGSL